jgi:hypothetical protein
MKIASKTCGSPSGILTYSGIPERQKGKQRHKVEEIKAKIFINL